MCIRQTRCRNASLELNLVTTSVKVMTIYYATSRVVNVTSHPDLMEHQQDRARGYFLRVDSPNAIPP